jgi:very-short-patch-repair endonuclease
MTSESISLTAFVAPVVSFAMHQASVPVINELRLRNGGDATVNDLTVTLTCDPQVIAARQWRFDRVAAGSEVVATDRTVALDGGLLNRLSERMKATVTIRVSRGNTTLTESVHDVIALARHEWGGSVSTPELLAAFVTPNDPAIAELLREASDKLREAGRSPALDGYQSESRERVWEMASAIWAAVASRQLIYAEPPASFERAGQKIRLPSEVLNGRLATCLDTAVLFAAALEQIGLHPLLCLTRGHALTAVWLQPSTLLGVSTDDASDLRTYVALNEMVLFETTVVTRQPPATFGQALEEGKRRVGADLDAEFVLALDIRQARARQVLPLPVEVERVRDGQRETVLSAALELAPSLPPFTPDEHDATMPETPQGRLDAWKRRLLDLTKRNRLLNLKPSKTAVALVCPDAARLEHILADNGKITIVPLDTLAGRGAGRDEAHLLAQRHVDFEQELARQALANKQLPARLNEAELKAGMVELFRKAKSDMEEGGANTLFLAIGMLRWRESESAATWHRAPLLLVPVKLERATAASPPRLVRHTDDTVFNMTLLEMLRQDFELRIPNLEGELPTDGSGIAVNQVITLVRTAIRDVPGWEVLDEMVLSTFSFAKYLMWKDLNDHTEALRGTPFVKHMIDSPRDPYTRTPTFIESRELDARIDPAALLTPLSCDSSQIAAIHASGMDGDFVLEGPPGTGKSQTIANLIAHNIGLGRKVLFVAEKMTALNVVQERLKKVGLGDFCLELHSSKANKRDVLAQLDRAWTNREEKTVDEWAHEAQKLKTIRDQLNGLVVALHTPGATGISPRAAIARASSSHFAPAVCLDWPPSLSADRVVDRAGLDRYRALASDLGLAFTQITTEDAQAFAALRFTNWSFQWQSALTNAATALIAAIDAAQVAAARFGDVTRLPCATDSAREIGWVADFAGALQRVAGMNLEAILAPDGVDVAMRLTKATTLLASHRSAVGTLSVHVDHGMVTASAVRAVTQAWEQANSRLWPLSFFATRAVSIDAMRRFDASKRPALASDLPTLGKIAALREEMDRITEALPASALWRGLNTDVPQVEALVRLGESARNATALLAQDPMALPVLRQQVRTLLVEGRDLLQPGMPVAVAAEVLVKAAERLANSMTTFASVANLPAEHQDSLPAVRSLAAAVLERAPRLNAWCRWQEKRELAVRAGLSVLTMSLEAGLIRSGEITAAFEVSYARWMAPLVIDDRPELRQFSAVEHQHLLTTFRALDKALATLAAKTIRAKASTVIPRKGDADAIPGFGVLRREVQRRIGHAPVRKIVNDMGEALTRLTPCLLMSPHSVAQFLSAGSVKFDLIVFDEASQIAVWDAIGAIARGRNVIVVGDPKQMPPTNFFGRTTDTDDASDDDVSRDTVGDLESILDEGLATGMYHHRLTGHYRSQHESLIAFSNHHYYGGELVTYPAAVTQTSAVSFRRCQGAYQKGRGRTNPEEAKAVVAEIVERLRDPARQHQTIGVVTMNAEQQRLIRNLLDDARRHTPELESGFRDSAGEEVEMVYNLETVQGHERDVIMISVGYGPTVAGDRTMSMNFGPLNRSGGERRLNVAVTRATREVIVFASFDPEMIDLTRTSAQAVHDLKAYLDFANRGPVALARQASFAGGIDEFDSIFEEHVTIRLRAKGWNVQTQVGVSKFRIDLGIVHPDFPGRFLAGVECDGATFHSSPTARDRDRVRHDVLTAMGWQIVRLWSTDFFIDADTAIARIHDALTELLAKDRERLALEEQSSGHAGVYSASVEEIDDRSSDLVDDTDDDADVVLNEVVLNEVAIEEATVNSTLAAEVVDQDNAVKQAEYSAAPLPFMSPMTGEHAPLHHHAALLSDDDHLARLGRACIALIDRAGPITFVYLAEKMAHAREVTGGELKKRVWAAVGNRRRTSRAPSGAVTFWPEGSTPSSHVPYRGDVVAGETRSWQATPYAEKLGLALEIVKAEPLPPKRVAAMTQRIGAQRLRAREQSELEELLESAAGMEEAP